MSEKLLAEELVAVARLVVADDMSNIETFLRRYLKTNSEAVKAMADFKDTLVDFDADPDLAKTFDELLLHSKQAIMALEAHESWAGHLLKTIRSIAKDRIQTTFH